MPRVLTVIVTSTIALVLAVVVMVIVFNRAEANAHTQRAEVITACISDGKDPSTCAVRWATYEKDPDKIPPADPAATKLFNDTCASTVDVYACAKGIPVWPNGAPEYDINAGKS